MLEEAKQLLAWQPKAVVKIPCTLDGLKATRALAGQGVKVNLTLVFSATQALLAAKAGAYLVSPFIGRFDDNGSDGMQVSVYACFGVFVCVLFAGQRGRFAPCCVSLVAPNSHH